MGFECKLCKNKTSTQTGLLQHYRLRHGHGGKRLPCVHQDCFCSFKTWGSLRSHLSRQHSHEAQQSVRSETLSFTCQCCSSSAIPTERDFFEHLGRHLKKYESVVCVFKNCNFSTNIHGTFASHKSRKHTPHPQGETSESLEKERVELLSEVMKKDNGQVVAGKMAKTFSLRRQEIIHEAPAIRDFMQRWPALFDATQINDEFKRITTVNLEATFMAKLDQCTQKLMDVVSSRGGASGARIRKIKDMLIEHNTIKMRREVAIRCLVVYLGEKEEDLFKEFGDNEEFETSLESHVMKIAIVGDRSTPESDH